MTIKDVLEADWTVSKLRVTIRTSQTQLVERYEVGPDPKRPKYGRFLHTTKAGDVYMDREAKVVLVDETIQFYDTDLPYRGNKPVGVILDRIPPELLSLPVSHMFPTGGGGSNGWHGYDITAVHDHWTGVLGEDVVIQEETGNEQ